MKKLLLSLVACFIAIAANAWTVSFTNPENWAQVSVYTFSPETEGGWPGKLMTKSGDVWTYTGTGNPAKIIFNNNNQGKQTGNLDFVDGETYNMYGPVNAQLNDYTVYFENVAGWEKVYVYTWGPEACGGWPGKELTQGTDGKYAWTYQATSEPTFDGIIFTAGSDGPKTGDLTYKVGTIYSNGEIGGSGIWVNIGGSFNDNNFYDGGVEAVDGVAVFPSLAIGDGTFKVKTYITEDKYYIYSETAVPTGTPVQFVEDVYDVYNTISGGVAGASYKVEVNVNTMMVTITPVGDGPVTPGFTMPSKVYLQGNANGNVFAANVGIEGEVLADGVFGWDDVKIEGENGGADGYINFATVIGTSDDWDEGPNTGNRFGAPAGDTPLVKGEEGKVALYAVNVSASGCQSWKIANGTYGIVLNLNEMTIELVDAGTVGVESVAVAEGEAVYFNLQGVRVANPERGIFVKVQNGKASKVVL